MRGMREIKRRIRSVQSTQKITRAMEMVAAAKLRRAEERASAARPYAGSIKEAIGRVLLYSGNIGHPLMEPPESVKKCYVVFTSDRGLCGSYNTNVLRLTMQETKGLPREEVQIVAVGRKAREHFRRRDYNIIGEYLDIEDRPAFIRAQEMGAYLQQLFLDGTAGEIYAVYNEYVNPMIQRPTCQPLLPMSSGIFREEAAARDEEERQAKKEEKETTEGAEREEDYLYRFEPEPAAVLDAFLPRFLYSLIFTSLLEAKASEFGARMTAMRMASDNAKDMIHELTLKYNKARQAAITQEILEIVNTSEALGRS